MVKSDSVLLCDDVCVGYAATSIGQHLQPEPMEPTCPIGVRPNASSFGKSRINTPIFPISCWLGGGRVVGIPVLVS